MKKNNNFILRHIADDIILVPIGEMSSKFNGMILLNEIGAYIWEHIEETPDFSHLIDLILDEYDIDRETASADVSTFLMQLLQYEIVYPEKDNW